VVFLMRLESTPEMCLHLLKIVSIMRCAPNWNKDMNQILVCIILSYLICGLCIALPAKIIKIVALLATCANIVILNLYNNCMSLGWKCSHLQNKSYTRLYVHLNSFGICVQDALKRAGGVRLSVVLLGHFLGISKHYE